MWDVVCVCANGLRVMWDFEMVFKWLNLEDSGGWVWRCEVGDVCG